MATPYGGTPGSVRPGDRVRLNERARRRLRWASVAALLAGLLATVSSVTPWWYLSTPTGRVEYYPGTSVYVTGGGGGGLTTYANSGVASVGDLYLLVLAGAVAVAVLGWCLGGYGLARMIGRIAGGRRLARVALLASIFLSVLLLAAVPFAQPALYAAANPARACTSAAPPGACTSFWGSSHGPTGSTVWGAGAGWWFLGASAILLLLALWLGTVAAVSSADLQRAREKEAEARRDVNRRAALSAYDLERLAELKALADAGTAPREKFLEEKRRLLAPLPAGRTEGPDPNSPLPARELELLKTLHEQGTLTDEEYAVLERRALLWI